MPDGARRAWATAVEIALIAVEHSVAAAVVKARAMAAHACPALLTRGTRLAEAFLRARSAAVDAGLATITQPVVAGRLPAEFVDTHPEQAVPVRAAALSDLAAGAAAAAVHVGLVEILDAVEAAGRVWIKARATSEQQRQEASHVEESQRAQADPE